MCVVQHACFMLRVYLSGVEVCLKVLDDQTTIKQSTSANSVQRNKRSSLNKAMRKTPSYNHHRVTGGWFTPQQQGCVKKTFLKLLSFMMTYFCPRAMKFQGGYIPVPPSSPPPPERSRTNPLQKHALCGEIPVQEQRQPNPFAPQNMRLTKFNHHQARQCH